MLECVYSLLFVVVTSWFCLWLYQDRCVINTQESKWDKFWMILIFSTGGLNALVTFIENGVG